MNRKYTETHKSEAVKLGLELGGRQASKSLGIPLSTVEGWLRKHNQEISSSEVASDTQKPSPTEIDLSMENNRLKSEIKRLEETVSILSDATAFFAQRQKK